MIQFYAVLKFFVFNKEKQVRDKKNCRRKNLLFIVKASEHNLAWVKPKFKTS